MALTPETIRTIRADLAQGFTPLVVAEPGHSTLTALCEEFDPVAIIDAAQIVDERDLALKLDRSLAGRQYDEDFIIIHGAHKVHQYLGRVLRQLTLRRDVLNYVLPQGLKLIFIAENGTTGIGHTRVSLFEHYGIVIREAEPTPELGGYEITQGLKDLQAHLDGLITSNRQVGDHAAAENVLRMRQCLTLATSEKYVY